MGGEIALRSGCNFRLDQAHINRSTECPGFDQRITEIISLHQGGRWATIPALYLIVGMVPAARLGQ